MITIGYSTRKHNPEYQEYLQKTCMYKEVQIIEKINNGDKSLSKVYNEILLESKYDIVVLCHDDLEFDTNRWGDKLLKSFEKNPEYGILGLAGTKFLDKSGQWWKVPQTMYGIVNHKHEGKKWTSTYSTNINDKIEETIIVDGLFIAVDKRKIKHNFDESINGFHFYDLGFCLPNYLDGVKIGVTFNNRVTHLSIGQTNEQWEKNRQMFSEKYFGDLSIDITDKNQFQTFIFCHDQDIILQYEESNKFNMLSDFKYVFLGKRNIDKIIDKPNVIIARNLENNIEHHNELCSFTGWYALWKNGYINSKYINLFEYDVIISEYFEQFLSKLIYEKVNMVGYIPFPCNNYHFIDNPQWVDTLFKGIKQIYNLDFEKTIRQMMSKNPKMLWSSTSNSTMSIEFFESYMKWFEPMINIVAESKTAGGGHERSMSIFSIFKKIPITLTNGIIKHYQMDSHKHQGHYVDYEKNINELVNNII